MGALNLKYMLSEYSYFFLRGGGYFGKTSLRSTVGLEIAKIYVHIYSTHLDTNIPCPEYQVRP
jgi:hypothetical protein